MSADPLADVLREAEKKWIAERLDSDGFWPLMARAARAHIAKEIEAVEDDQPPMLRNSLGLREAARIARRDTE